MIKKIRLFILSFITILWVWVSFADVIPDNSHYLKRCSKLEDAEIDKYKVVYAYTYDEWPDWCWHGPFNLCSAEESKLRWRVVEYDTEKCLPAWNMKIYLLGKRENIDILTQDNIDEKAIFMWNIDVQWWKYVDNSNPLTEENTTYKIEKKGDDYKLKLTESNTWILLDNVKLIKFWIAWIMTILIETIVLFFIAKLFRKKDQISNWMLILVWVLASTITLPLLRFVLPLFVVDGVEYTVIWELLVTIIEVFIIKYWLKISRGKAILVSIVCNVASYSAWFYLFNILYF